MKNAKYIITRVPKGLLKEIADELNVNHATLRGRWWRQDPFTANYVLNRMLERAKIKAENDKIVKQLNNNSNN